jgi:SAM-dependent methyltransferase
MSEKIDSEKACPVCESSTISPFFQREQVPIYCNLLWPSREEALHAPKGDICLAFCKVCGHIFNVAFDPERLEYTENYENSLHFSPRFQAYTQSLAKRLVKKYDLHNKDIIEIGCGKGEFLTLLCDIGGNRGIGFDPSFVPGRVEKPKKEEIIFIRDYYSEDYTHYKADFICCRQVLEHIPSPRGFLMDLRHATDDRTGAGFFFEVPNAMFTLKDLSIWDVIYEHRSYFSASSLAYLLSSCGFSVVNLREAFDGQFLSVEAMVARDSGITVRIDPKNLETVTKYVGRFAESFRKKMQKWTRELGKMRREGYRVMVWGGGSKGVTFLNMVGDLARIEHLIDINPWKQGKYVAGTGQKIVPPQFLRQHEPDVIIVMNAIYMEEIRQLLSDMDVSTKLLPV